jgi:hypothetical protein
MRPLVTLACMAIATNGNVAYGGFVTWTYTGHVSYESNAVDVPSPFGLPVSVTITFDPNAPDEIDSPLAGEYAMAGGETALTLAIGKHVSAPVDRFSVDAIIDYASSGTSDGYGFLNYEGTDWMPISFPGYFEGLALLEFRGRHTPGPISSDALPTQQLNPSDFDDAGITVVMFDPSGHFKWNFGATLDPVTSVPEPASDALWLAGFASLMFSSWSRSLRFG